MTYELRLAEAPDRRADPWAYAESYAEGYASDLAGLRDRHNAASQEMSAVRSELTAMIEHARYAASQFSGNGYEDAADPILTIIAEALLLLETL